MLVKALRPLGVALPFALFVSALSGFLVAGLELALVDRLQGAGDLTRLLSFDRGTLLLVALVGGRALMLGGLTALDSRLQRGLVAKLARLQLATLLRASPFAPDAVGREAALDSILSASATIVARPFAIVAAAAREPVRLVGLTALLATGGPTLILLLIALSLGVALVARWVNRRMAHAADSQHDAIVDMMDWGRDGIERQSTWLIGGAIEVVEEGFAKSQRAFNDATGRGMRWSAALQLTFRLAGHAAIVGGVWLIARQHGPARTAGQLAALAVAASWLQGPLATLFALRLGRAQSRQALERLDGLRARAPVEPRAATGVELTPPQVGFVLTQVSFAYDAAPVLDALDLTWRRGSCIGICGPSGSGKSTMVRLMARLVNPTAGTIQLDGHELASLSTASLRSQLSAMLQPPELVRGSLRENLSLGSRSETGGDGPIWDVLREVGLDDLVTRLPRGLDTPCGDGGLKVSTGQAVRLAVARVLIAAPAVALFDEPTASVDPAAANRVLAALARFIPGKTVCLVSHDPRVLALCDVVYELAEGKLALRATHTGGAPASPRSLGRARRQLAHGEALE